MILGENDKITMKYLIDKLLINIKNAKIVLSQQLMDERNQMDYSTQIVNDRWLNPLYYSLSQDINLSNDEQVNNKVEISRKYNIGLELKLKLLIIKPISSSISDIQRIS
uniref:Uncharacterized protein n=1 Tax=Meloidogyne enterolobii TaxID=390850 RepID=A0A6V7TXZ6_MELEN|nr:unnamed protein product [Meloidogyne enterolobii]